MRAIAASIRPLPDGGELGRLRDTDFYCVCDLLTPEERAIRNRVRTFCDEQVAPIATDFWERAEFPGELMAG